MIELTKEEALQLLRNISSLDGYLVGLKAENRYDVLETFLLPTVGLIIEKLKESK